MSTTSASQTIQSWPEQSREAAQLVIDQHGEPDEVTDSQFVWHQREPWKRIVATKAYFKHNFPTEHIDSVATFIDYRVPVDKFSDLAAFDGSIKIERTSGEVSARCHDEQANMLALNLMHDIVTGAKNVDEARSYYAEEFLNYRRKQPTPYMEKLHFSPGDASAADPDVRLLSDEDLQKAVDEGKSHG
ncbi:hypothetical protein [Pseudomonas profundi]|uniref:hypothetical protein n=1 Tax=Pseudomonas profundi TaxID=1981513 RepID=UPI00123A98AB|nr:hypothetical protein [Pseudomonas profundi]